MEFAATAILAADGVSIFNIKSTKAVKIIATIT